MAKAGKLEVRNNWEYLEWSWNGNKMDPKMVESVTVHWPDGTVEKLPVVVTTRSASYSDMGGPRQLVNSDTMHVVVDYNGHQTNMPLYGNGSILHLVHDLQWNVKMWAAAVEKLTADERDALGIK